jgi:hypothetical protein
MFHRSSAINKKILEKALIKHHSGNRFEDLTKGEFFNEAFKKSLLPSHKRPTTRQPLPLITG